MASQPVSGFAEYQMDIPWDDSYPICEYSLFLKSENGIVVCKELSILQKSPSSRSNLIFFLVALALAAVACTSDDNSSSQCRQMDSPGFLKGRIQENGFEIDASFGMMVRQSGCSITGLLEVGVPLYGSGPFEGRIDGDVLQMTASADANESAKELSFTGSYRSGAWSGEYKISDETGIWNLDSDDVNDFYSGVFDMAALTMADIDDTNNFEFARNRIDAVLFENYDLQLSIIESYGFNVFDSVPFCLDANSIPMNIVDMNQSETRHRAGFFAAAAADSIAKLGALAERSQSLRLDQVPITKDLCLNIENDLRQARGWPLRTEQN